MKTQQILALASVLAFGFSATASAGCMKGIPCISDMGSNGGYHNSGNLSSIRLGGSVEAWGSNFGSVQANRPVEASGYTLSETKILIDSSINFTSDDQAGCTECGDNQTRLSIQAMDTQAVGVQSFMAPVTTGSNSPVNMGSHSSAISNVSGNAWADRFGNTGQ